MGHGAGPITGVDLGTTFSSIAFLNAFGRAEIVPTPTGERSIPSVVLFEEGSGAAVVGRAAKERSIELPERVVEFVKRDFFDRRTVRFPREQFEVGGKLPCPASL